MQANSQPGWDRLAQAIKDARIAKGYVKRAPFSRHAQIDDSTMATIEGARPGTVSEEMLDFVTGQLGWRGGEWATYLDSDAPTTRRDKGGLAAVTDDELLEEMGRRLRALRAASRTQRAG